MSNGPTPESAVETVTGSARRREAAIDTTKIGRYFVLDRLGQGGMGVVVAAYDPELDRRVAIKLLQSPKHARSQLRLFREAQAMARLSHPNVVQVYEVGTADERIYLAMELVVGQTLRAWLQAQPRSWHEIVEAFVAAGRGLAAAHAQGLVHRDFKPDNVLVAEDGRVRVADFGVAAADDQTETSTPSFGAASYLAKAITVTGSVVGTPRYMAPEQHAALPIGPAADQFAFCIALHEALYDERPFAGDSLVELAENVMHERVRAPADPTRVPRFVASAVRQGLRADPVLRHASMDALLEQLCADPARARRRRARVGVTAGAIASAIAAAGWGWNESATGSCTQGEEIVESTWNDARRAALTAKFGGVEDVGLAVERSVDHYTRAWVDAHREMCASHRDGGVSDALFDASMACLDRRHAALEQLLRVVDEAADPTTTAAAAAKLASVDECTDREALQRDVPAPADPERAEAAEAIRTRLAAAKVTHDAGEVSTAAQELEAIASDSDALAHDPLTAEVGLVRGRLAMDRRDWAAARVDLQRASTRGIASGMDVLAAEAEARLVFVDAMLSDEPLAALAREPLAHALAERAGDLPWLRALAANNAGAVHAIARERDSAERAFAEAFDLAERFGGVDPIDHSGYALNVARFTRDPDRRDALFLRAQALVEDALGPSHFEALDHAFIRAKHIVDPARALEVLVPVCPRFAAREGDDAYRCWSCFWRASERHDALGDREAAREAASAAGQCLAPERTATDPRPILDPLRDMTRAWEAVLADDAAAALDAVAEAERKLAPVRDLPWIAVEIADLSLLKARALDSDGRVGEAASDLIAAIATYEQEIAASEDRAAHDRVAQARALLRRAEAGR